VAIEGTPLYRYRFGDVVFNEARMELRVGGLVPDVEPAPLKILSRLLKNPGETVPNAELWGMVGSKDALYTAINRLRGALNDKKVGEDYKWIVNESRVGYRFGGKLDDRIVTGFKPISALKLEPDKSVPNRPEFGLAQLLGRTKFSEVWRATNGAGEQRVFKFALDETGLVLLKREATLARMLHQVLGERDDIVRVFAWNFTTAPFYLESEDGGADLSQWADDGARLRTMPLADRLRLFTDIAVAVAAAHRAAVLHEDISPANILISRKGDGWQVKLNDFGAGRVLEPERLAESGFSQFGLTTRQGVANDLGAGTLPYLAPELRAGHEALVPSDVYALGLLLYQMAAGDLRKPMASGWQRDIPDDLLIDDITAATDVDPERRLSTVDALIKNLRTLEARREQARLAAESAERMRAAEEQARVAREEARVDAERARTAEERAQRAAEQALAAEEREQISRRLLTATRQWRTALGAIVVILVVGLAGTFKLYRDAARAQAAAEQARSVAEAQTKRALAMSYFLNDDVLANTGGWQTGTDVSPTMHGVLMRTAEAVGLRFTDDPASEAQIRRAIGEGLIGLDDNAEGLKQERLALAKYEQAFGPTEASTVDTMYTLAGNLMQDSQFAEAETLLNSAEQRLGAEQGRSIDLLTRAAVTRGFLQAQELDCEPALASFRKAEHVRMQSVPSDEELGDLINVREWIGQTLVCVGAYSDAQKQFEALLSTHLSGKELQPAVMAEVQLGYAKDLAFLGDRAKAEHHIGEGLKTFNELMGPDAFYTADAMLQAADTYIYLGELEKARSYAAKSYADFRKKPGAQSLYAMRALRTLGVVDVLSGNQAAAATSLATARAGLVKIVGNDRPDVQVASYWLALALAGSGQPANASPLLGALNAQALLQGEGGSRWDMKLNALRRLVAMRLSPSAENQQQFTAAIGEVEQAGESTTMLKPFRTR
jgi:non-specific serine/threonine protein kinase